MSADLTWSFMVTCGTASEFRLISISLIELFCAFLPHRAMTSLAIFSHTYSLFFLHALVFKDISQSH